MNQGTFTQLPINYKEEAKCKDSVSHWGGRTQYTYDCVYRKEDPSVIVKWLRRNFGERGNGLDFILIKCRFIIYIMD